MTPLMRRLESDFAELFGAHLYPDKDGDPADELETSEGIAALPDLTPEQIAEGDITQEIC